MRGASAAWKRMDEEPVGALHDKERLRNILLDNLSNKRARLTETSASLEDLILAARAEIASGMVYGDFGGMSLLEEAVHAAVQSSISDESTL